MHAADEIPPGRRDRDGLAPDPGPLPLERDAFDGESEEEAAAANRVSGLIRLAYELRDEEDDEASEREGMHGECVGCMVGLATDIQENAAEWDGFLNAVKQCKWRVSQARLFRTLEEVYRDAVRPALRRRGCDPGRWSRTSIRDHFLHHVVDMGMTIRRHIDTMRVISEAVATMVVVGEGAQRRVETRNAKTYLEMAKETIRLHTIDPTRSISYSGHLEAAGIVDRGSGRTRQL